MLDVLARRHRCKVFIKFAEKCIFERPKTTHRFKLKLVNDLAKNNRKRKVKPRNTGTAHSGISKTKRSILRLGTGEFTEGIAGIVHKMVEEAALLPSTSYPTTHLVRFSDVRDTSSSSPCCPIQSKNLYPDLCFPKREPQSVNYWLFGGGSLQVSLVEALSNRLHQYSGAGTGT